MTAIKEIMIKKVTIIIFESISIKSSFIKFKRLFIILEFLKKRWDMLLENHLYSFIQCDFYYRKRHFDRLIVNISFLDVLINKVDVNLSHVKLHFSCWTAFFVCLQLFLIKFYWTLRNHLKR